MVADLVTGAGDRSHGVGVFRERGILTDDEDSHREPMSAKTIDHDLAHGIEVRRERRPADVAVDLHVRPQVVEIERDAGERLALAVTRLAVAVTRPHDAPPGPLWSFACEIVAPRRDQIVPWAPGPSRAGKRGR